MARKKKKIGRLEPWDLMPMSKKQKRRVVLDRNRRRGQIGEEMVRLKYAMQGYEVKRTGRGSDFECTKRDYFTGRIIDRKEVEVKTGNAKLSELQKKTKKKKRNYRVERTEPFFW